jgi:hypothetical protein
MAMAVVDLTTREGLRAACLQVERASLAKASEWTEELAAFLEWVAGADESKRASEDFQRRLWDENPVSSPGQGNISVAKALGDADFRQWLARLLGIISADTLSTT